MKIQKVFCPMPAAWDSLLIYENTKIIQCQLAIVILIFENTKIIQCQLVIVF